MTNYAHGRAAETAAAQYLKKSGFDIVECNYRTKYCEIDIIAKKNKVVYLVEVKYRQTNVQGEGFDYITQKKLSQMTFAAEFWVSDNSWHGDYTLAAVEVAGDDFVVIDFLTDL